MNSLPYKGCSIELQPSDSLVTQELGLVPWSVMEIKATGVAPSRELAIQQAQQAIDRYWQGPLRGEKR